jgi:probable rRNA maturation factor
LEAAADIDVPPRSWTAIVEASEILARELFPKGRIALRIVGADEMRRLNREFRGIDKPTDVLSFRIGERRAGHIGDIALCWDEVLRQAPANGNPPEAEALAMLAHAMLHLTGLEHDTPEQRAVMDTRTLALCRRAGYEVHGFGH